MEDILSALAILVREAQRFFGEFYPYLVGVTLTAFVLVGLTILGFAVPKSRGSSKKIALHTSDDSS